MFGSLGEDLHPTDVTRECFSAREISRSVSIFPTNDAILVHAINTGASGLIAKGNRISVFLQDCDHPEWLHLSATIEPLRQAP